MQRICNEVNTFKLHNGILIKESHGTDWKNTHPICRLYAEQIAHLTGGGGCYDSAYYSEAYSEVEKKIAELKQ